MSKGTIAILSTLLLGGIIAGKVAVDKLKQKAANIDFNIGFNRIHGFMGEGISKFLSPVIRTIFTLSLKNFSGLNLAVNKIYTRIEVQKPGSLDWTVIASQVNYINIAVNDGTNKDVAIPVDIKGFAAIGSLTNRKNKHRAVVSYEFKGISGTYVKDLDLAGPIALWYDQQKKKFPALSGAINAPVQQITCLSNVA